MDGLLMSHFFKLDFPKFRISGQAVPFVGGGSHLRKNSVAINWRIDKELEAKLFPECFHFMP